MMQIKLCVCVCVCVCVYTVHVCVCVCVFIDVLCMQIYTDIRNWSLSSSGRDQYDNSCITHHIVPLWWNLLQPNKHPQFMPCEYLLFTYMQASSYSFPIQTVYACYMHSPWLLVWVLIILFDYYLIHLFVQHEILECLLQNINVTSLLTELTFTQMLKL